MPRLEQSVNVEVSDKGIDADCRKLELVIAAPSSLFSLSDMLVREGAIRGLDQVLKSSARRAVSDYIGSGREFIKKVGVKKKKEVAEVKK